MVGASDGDGAVVGRTYTVTAAEVDPKFEGTGISPKTTSIEGIARAIRDFEITDHHFIQYKKYIKESDHKKFDDLQAKLFKLADLIDTKSGSKMKAADLKTEIAELRGVLHFIDDIKGMLEREAKERAEGERSGRGRGGGGGAAHSVLSGAAPAPASAAPVPASAAPAPAPAASTPAPAASTPAPAPAASTPAPAPAASNPPLPSSLPASSGAGALASQAVAQGTAPLARAARADAEGKGEVGSQTGGGAKSTVADSRAADHIGVPVTPPHEGMTVNPMLQAKGVAGAGAPSVPPKETREPPKPSNSRAGDVRGGLWIAVGFVLTGVVGSVVAGILSCSEGQEQPAGIAAAAPIGTAVIGAGLFIGACTYCFPGLIGQAFGSSGSETSQAAPEGRVVEMTRVDSAAGTSSHITAAKPYAAPTGVAAGNRSRMVKVDFGASPAPGSVPNNSLSRHSASHRSLPTGGAALSRGNPVHSAVVGSFAASALRGPLPSGSDSSPEADTPLNNRRG